MQLNYGPDNKDITVFFRLNRGSEKVDHHCFFFFEGKYLWSCHARELLT